MANNQSSRLTEQHKERHGCVGIFGEEAKIHDMTVGEISEEVYKALSKEFKHLSFRLVWSLTKKEINKALSDVDPTLGQTLFVDSASISPDGGVIEVKDKNGKWRVVLVTEAKHQGKDIENIKQGILVGKNNDQDLMAAGNAIERAHKNIAEIANYMVGESHFPYVLFLEGTNFMTEDVDVTRPDGRVVHLEHNSGVLNRLDRLTAANFGMPINTNLCRNKVIKVGENSVMLRSTSIYTQGDGESWDQKKMFRIMVDVALTSLDVLSPDLPEDTGFSENLFE